MKRPDGRGAPSRVRASRSAPRLTLAPEGQEERARALLLERARRLARPVSIPIPRAGSPVVDLVVFEIARERYAVEARYVCEIARLTMLTPVPGAPPALAGVTSRRGEIVAVFDLRALLGAGGPGLHDLAWILVLGRERAELAILADAAHEVRRVDAGEITDPPQAARGEERPLRRGVTPDGLLVLDGEALLRDRRLFVNEGAEGGAAPGGSS